MSVGLRLKRAIKKCMGKYLPPRALFLIEQNAQFSGGGKRYSKKIFKNYYHGGASLKHETSSADAINQSKNIIFMQDGRTRMGGLADKLRGIASAYKMSEELGAEFKIHFTSPFELTNYLVPNQYDWRIDLSQIAYDANESAVYVFDTSIFWGTAMQKMQKILERRKQLHICTNSDYANTEYGAIFKHLFKPSPQLSALVERSLSEIGGDFISASFRFLDLLGDFDEGGGCMVLPEKQRQELISRCLGHLAEIHGENAGEKVLVTSDSLTFVNEAKKFDFVYAVPGKMAHTKGNSPALDEDAVMKTFVDYLLLAHAKKNYLVAEGHMYESHFAYTASLHRSTYIVKRYV